MHIRVLSGSIKTPPENLDGKVQMYSGGIPDLIKELESKGFKRAYIDGGATISSFLELKLISEMVITIAPVLLGGGIPLFGKLNRSLKLENARASAFANGFIQIKYSVDY